MYAMRGFALFNLKQFAPALDALDEYRRLYRAFYERKLDLSDMGTVGLHGINDEYLMRSLYVSAQCCLALNDKERAKTYIGQVDISSLAAAYPDLPFLADEFDICVPAAIFCADGRALHTDYGCERRKRAAAVFPARGKGVSCIRQSEAGSGPRARSGEGRA